jgi:hypothetical protein
MKAVLSNKTITAGGQFIAYPTVSDIWAKGSMAVRALARFSGAETRTKHNFIN